MLIVSLRTTHLGDNKDCGSRLVDSFLQEFNSRNQRTKCALSRSGKAHIKIDSLIESTVTNSLLSSATFEDVSLDYFRKYMEPVQQMLRDAKLTHHQLHGVVLVGGSTLTPKIQQLQYQYFYERLMQEARRYKAEDRANKSLR